MTIWTMAFIFARVKLTLRTAHLRENNDFIEATLTTYNVAHLLGERKTWGTQTIKSSRAFQLTRTQNVYFINFMPPLYNLHDVIMLQEMPGVYHNKSLSMSILEPIVAEMNRMLAEEYTRQRNCKEGKKDYLMYKYVSLCNDNRYWHSMV